LRSPYVITFYGVVLTKMHCAIVMEFCPLGSLAVLIKKEELNTAIKMKYALGCARGMQFLHANHIMHRDLKTDNLLVVSKDPSSSVHVKLTDFGASRLVSDEGAATYTKGVGTANYMPPEILNNQAYSSKADVYSFALVVWSIFSQKHPFEDFANQY
jgi:serine/threonine protein kinase